MNMVILIGNLTRDPERKVTGTGTTVIELGLAIPSTRKNEDGTYKTDFFDVVAYGKTAENCLRYLSKGKKAAVIARLEDVHFTDHSGKARRLLRINAQSVEFLTPRSGSGQDAPDIDVMPDMFQDVSEEDIPFN